MGRHQGNPQKHFAIFLPGLYGGGAERTMLNLAHGLSGRGCSVDLVLSCADGPYLTEVSESVRLVELGSLASRASANLVHSAGLGWLSAPRTAEGTALSAELRQYRRRVGKAAGHCSPAVGNKRAEHFLLFEQSTAYYVSLSHA